MKKFLSGLILLLIISQSIFVHAQSKECLTALEEYFATKVSKESATEFLALQGELTLNRLSWVYLKSHSQSSEGKIESFEKTIIELLNEKYSNTDPEFIKAREAFEAQPLSRNALMNVAPYLKDYFAKDYAKEDELFHLNESDVKLLGILAQYEGKTKSGSFDDRMLNNNSTQSILNFTKLINSSYQSVNTKDLVEDNLELLEKSIAETQEVMRKVFAQVDVPPECSDKDCHPDFTELLNSSEEVQVAVLKGILRDKISDTEILKNLGYGDIWPKVKKGYVKRTELSRPKENVSKNKSSTPKGISSSGTRYGVIRKTTPKKTSGSSSSNSKTNVKQTPVQQKSHPMEVLITDPVSVIVKDKKGRTSKDWASFDKGYKTNMAEAILNDEKVFEHNGKLFYRQSGRQASESGALSLIPPKKREEYNKILKNVKNPKFKTQMLKAMVNGDPTFLYDGKLYSYKGQITYPGAYIANLMTLKTKKKFDKDRYDGMDKTYLTVRANALSNGKPYFIHKGSVMDTFSGRSVNNERRPAQVQNVKLNKEKRKMYEYMDYIDVIRNYHRDEIGNNCAYYGVIDKKSAKLTVYKKDGSALLTKEVLIGSKSGDQRTRWTDYANKRTTQSTGAGMFTVRKSDPNDSYNKKVFNNNIISFYDENGQETVFAIHQVPVNLQSRNSRFGTGDVSDRKLTNGCANLKVSDFDEIEKYLGPSCKVYVLPEESQNKLVYKDDKIRLVNQDGVSPNTDKFYHYSSNDYSPLPITMSITNDVANTATAKEFVGAISAEKSKLMKGLGISNDEYNELALVAFGIMGNESKFGTSKKLFFKEGSQGLVVLGKFLKSGDLGESINTSRGYTQIKYLPEEFLSKHYPEIAKSTLIKPRDSAVATMVYLAEAYKALKGVVRENAKDPNKIRITQETMIKYIGYFYQGGRSKVTTTDEAKKATPEWNEYYQGLVRNMSYLEITQGL